MAVVGRGGAHLDEEGTAVAQGLEVALPALGIPAGLLSQNLQIVAEALVVRVQHRVGTIGG
ncbi:hypothetical protein D3C72_2064840 [compost metagenome]